MPFIDRGSRLITMYDINEVELNLKGDAEKKYYNHIINQDRTIKIKDKEEFVAFPLNLSEKLELLRIKDKLYRAKNSEDISSCIEDIKILYTKEKLEQRMSVVFGRFYELRDILKGPSKNIIDIIFGHDKNSGKDDKEKADLKLSVYKIMSKQDVMWPEYPEDYRFPYPPQVEEDRKNGEYEEGEEQEVELKYFINYDDILKLKKCDKLLKLTNLKHNIKILESNIKEYIFILDKINCLEFFIGDYFDKEENNSNEEENKYVPNIGKLYNNVYFIISCLINYPRRLFYNKNEECDKKFRIDLANIQRLRWIIKAFIDIDFSLNEKLLTAPFKPKISEDSIKKLEKIYIIKQKRWEPTDE